MESIFGLMVFLIYTCTLIEGEIRCYCNESGCVSTGYMCKSQIGQCYSLVSNQEETTQASVRGCADALPQEQLIMCSREGGELIRTSNAPDEWPVLLCCKDDMCNYKKLDISIVVNTKSNDSSYRGDKPNPAPSAGSSGRGTHVIFPQPRKEEHRNPEKDLWFKAAVIAVPIAGGFILVLLVLLAVRMLRTDNSRRRRLVQVRRERCSLTKAQLYVTDHFSPSDKPEKSCSLFGGKHNSVCKEVNVKVDKDGKIYEPVFEKDSINRITQPSVIIWGKPKKSDLATVV